MRAKLVVENPGEIEMTLTVTMKLKDWDKLRDQVGDACPGWQFKSQINDMVAQATRRFYPTQTEDDGV